jgi:predicted Zn-dependent peptidase
MKMLFPISLIFAGALAAQAPMQQPAQSIAGVVRYNKVPISKEPLKVKLPRPVERQLSNGIKLLVVENHRIPEISLRINIPTGDLRNPPGLQGLADATAALIRLGTKTRSSKDIAETLAELGATINFGSGQDGGGVSLTAMTENFDAALDLLTDILLNPTFPQDEFDKWKTRQRAQLEQAKSQPGTLAFERLMKALYPDDARQDTRPTLDSLNKMTRDNVLEHYRSYYLPSGQWAGIAGDINAKDAAAKLEKALGAWKGGPVAKITMPLPAPIEEKKVYLVPRPNSVQTFLAVANRAIDRSNPDYIACQVMNRVLGSGPSSRLFRIIREEKGYTYGISSGFAASKVTNYFTASTSVRTDVTEPALAELLHQFADIRDRPVPEGELADAKSAIVASFVLGLESAQSVLGRWMEQRDYGFPEDYWDTYSQKVMAITAEDVQRVAKKYVPLDNSQIIAVGDGTKIAELLKKFGPVSEFPPE